MLIKICNSANTFKYSVLYVYLSYARFKIKITRHTDYVYVHYSLCNPINGGCTIIKNYRLQRKVPQMGMLTSLV